MSNEIRVRYAPSPTGHLHIGNARTALFNYLFARSRQGKFIVRIEDTDQKRNVEGGAENQLNFMKWLGLDWDESIDVGGPFGPYRQMERLDTYKEMAAQLFERGLAYNCFCTEAELEQERQSQMDRGETPKYSRKCAKLSEAEQAELKAAGREASVRFTVPSGRDYVFDDLVKGEVRFEADGFGDFVIMKKDGIPTYNFAVVIDDHLMRISHVLRGDDHISNTPRQLMIYEAFGWTPPLFGHMSLIVNDQRRKLSKRDESIIQFIEQYYDLGYLPEALFNFIALLGWSPGGEEEIFAPSELIERFDPERLSKSPAVFDGEKLLWISNHYIKHADPDRIVSLALPYLQKAGQLPVAMDAETEAWASALIRLYQDRMRYVGEITQLSKQFFNEEVHYDEEATQILQEEQVPEVLSSFAAKMRTLEPYTAAEIKNAVKEVQKETGQKGRRLFMPIRAAVTGERQGPDLNETLYLLGRERVLKQLVRWSN